MKTLRAALYARVSTNDQNAELQMAAMRRDVKRRGWKIAHVAADVASGASGRPARDAILELARRGKIDVVVVWKLDRWGRSMADLALTLADLRALGVAFVSITEAVDLTTPTGRAMAGLLSVFAEFERELIRERVLAGLQRARADGKLLGRPRTAGRHKKRIRELASAGLSVSEIARRLGIARSSVRRWRVG